MTGMTTELQLTWADISQVTSSNSISEHRCGVCYSKYEYQNRPPNPNKNYDFAARLKLTVYLKN